MFLFLNGTSIMFFITTLSFWIIASFLVQSLPFSKHYRSLKIKRNILRWFIIVNALIASIWILLVISTWLWQGWLFVEGMVKVMVPLYLLANLAVLLITFPRLRSLEANNHEPLAKETRIELLHPHMKIPIFAATLASGMNLYMMLFANPVLPNLFETLIWPLILLLLLFIPSFFVIKSYEHAVQGENRPTSIWKRLLKTLSIIGLMSSAVIVIILVNVFIGVSTTKLPASYRMMNHHQLDAGKKKLTHSQQHHVNSAKLDVKNLRGDIQSPADKKFTLIATQKTVTLQSGKQVKAWTYNGKIAPSLRVREGEMVEVKLINRDISKGVTIHWHGYNVPNAMDGVPGMTQNVVKPGGIFVYKFRAQQVGTYWFHSHQQASEQVEKGLFGILIVDPKKETHPYQQETTVVTHKWKTVQGYTMSFGNNDRKQMKQVNPGQKVRIRIINATNLSRQYLLNGTNFKVTSIDGVPIQNPGQLSAATSLQIAAGGRYDLTFTMPHQPVHLGMSQSEDEQNLKSPEILFITHPKQKNPVIKKGNNQFDPTQYGKGIQNDLAHTTQFDREFKMIMGNQMGFYDGKMSYLWTINGKVFPNTPTYLVKQGEKIKMTFINRSLSEHPMHLHGHHMLVLTKNGKKVKTPWLIDTLNVQMGESYEVAFIADNPGMWMDHCHNLDHAKVGMTMHLMYENVTSSFEVGAKSGNIPD